MDRGQLEGMEREREFRAEIEELLRVGISCLHPNLVTLYGWCLYESEKGNFEDVISGKECRYTYCCCLLYCCCSIVFSMLFSMFSEASDCKLLVVWLVLLLWLPNKSSRCRKGVLTEWSNCAYSTSETNHLNGKWNSSELTKNQYVKKWFKTQKVKKRVRIIPPSTPSTLEKQTSNGLTQSLSYSEKLRDPKVLVIRFSSQNMNECKAKIESVGGQFHPKIKKETNCLLVSGVPDKLHAGMRKARKMKYPIVREDYLVDGFKRKKKIRFHLYRIQASEEDNKSMITVSVKEGISKVPKVIMVHKLFQKSTH